MLGLFKKSEKIRNVIEIKSPLTGKTMPLEEVPDEVFSTKAMGDGIAILPENDIVVSPIDGEVVMIMKESKHAVAIEHKNGIQIFIHIGLDTVNLNGEGFEILTSLNETVKVGTPLIKFDQDFLKSKGLSTITMVIVTEPVNGIKSIENLNNTVMSSKDNILICNKF